MTRAPLAHLVAAATLVAAAAGVFGSVPVPASAASCASSSGVTVVVDPGSLGGAVTSACDSGDGQAASQRYADIGAALTFVQRQPGFLCRVNGVPARDPCVNTPPADAYWGLFWTDGKSGSWTYSTIGITGLQVPQGGAVAVAWQQGNARHTPSFPALRQATPTPTPGPTPSPSPTAPTKPPTSAAAPTPAQPPSAAASTQATPPPATPVPTSSPSPRRPAKLPSRHPVLSADATPTPSTDAATSPAPAATPVTDATSDGGDRVPTWVTLLILTTLLVSISVMAAAARRRRTDL